jgi:hypothetical protein
VAGFPLPLFHPKPKISTRMEQKLKTSRMIEGFGFVISVTILNKAIPVTGRGGP